MHAFHTAVWIDHQEAKIFEVDRSSEATATVKATLGHLHRHATVTAERQHPADVQRFFQEIARVLEGAQEILVLGPASAKLELVKHLRDHSPAVATRIVGVETVDHPTDGQITAYARKYFRAADRML